MDEVALKIFPFKIPVFSTALIISVPGILDLPANKSANRIILNVTAK